MIKNTTTKQFQDSILNDPVSITIFHQTICLCISEIEKAYKVSYHPKLKEIKHRLNSLEIEVLNDK